MNPDQYSGRTLAFLGDAVWSLCVRRQLLADGIRQGEALQRESVKYVSAKAQAAFYLQLHDEHFFSDEEEGWYRRGRNGSTSTTARNTPVLVYRQATGFEAILGALELLGDQDRIETIWKTVRERQEAAA